MYVQCYITGHTLIKLTFVMLTTPVSVCTCICLLYYDDELSSSSGSSLITDHSSVNIKLPSITPTTTPRPPCMCNMTDCVCNTRVYVSFQQHLLAMLFLLLLLFLVSSLSLL